MTGPRLRLSLATTGHLPAADGSWATPTGLVAHLQQLLSLEPGPAGRMVIRSRLQLPPEWQPAHNTAWHFTFRAPGGRWVEALGCAARCPVEALTLHRSPDGHDLIPDAAQLAQIQSWLTRVQVSCDVAVIVGFPRHTADGAQVPLWLWLPRLWLLDHTEQVREIACVLDKLQSADELCAEIADLLRDDPDTAHRTPPENAEFTSREADLRSALGQLDDSADPLEEVVLGWPRPIATGRSAAQVRSHLRQRRTDAWCVTAHWPGGQMLCASPELLARSTVDGLHTLALAGTVAADQPVDERLLREHRAVITHLTDALQRLGARVDLGPLERRSAGTLHHLATPVHATRDQPLEVLTAALHLHPTPALLGAPRAIALQAIEALEPELRSWYGGFAGILSGCGDGGGELAVLLRGAEPYGDGWRTWAGAGLVAGTTVAAEKAEIMRKHQAIEVGLGLGEGP